MSKKEKKNKKEKVRYIDDGRTVSDMSGVHDGMRWAKHGTTSSPKEIIKTFWNAVKMMFLPMLVVIGFLIVLYLILTIIFWLMI